MDDIKEPIEPPAKPGKPGKAGGRPDKVVNRRKLIGAVTDRTGLPRAKAVAAVDAVFEAMVDSLKGGKEVRLFGFGAFVVSERKGGKGRAPRTGAEIQVPQSKSIRFRAGKVLREQIGHAVIDTATAKGEEAREGG